MTREDIKAMLGDLDLPLAYHHFAEGEAPELPYIVYHYPESDNFAADNVAFAKGDNLSIELYTDKRDFDTEGRLEDILDEQDLFYVKTEIFIPSEDMYEILYEMEGAVWE